MYRSVVTVDIAYLCTLGDNSAAEYNIEHSFFYLSTIYS